MGLYPVAGPKRCAGCGADASHSSAHRHPAEGLPPVNQVKAITVCLSGRDGGELGRFL
jgi:hypothetical protein